MAESIEWYYVADNEQVGPVSFNVISDLILARKLTRDSYVWRSDFEEWLPIAKVESLASFLPQNSQKLTMRGSEDSDVAEAKEAPGVSVYDYLAQANKNPNTKAAQNNKKRKVELEYNYEHSLEDKLFMAYVFIGLVGAIIVFFFHAEINEFLARYQVVWMVVRSESPVLAWVGGYTFYFMTPALLVMTYRQFQCGIMWGIGALLVPFVSGLVCLIFNWQRMKRIFGFFMCMVLVILGIITIKAFQTLYNAN